MYKMDYELNFCTLNDYRDAFQRHLEVLKEFPDRIEGKKFLTPKIRQELKKYTEEKLLTAFITVIARKKRSKNGRLEQ